MPTPKQVNVEQLKKALDSGQPLELVDVRNFDEFRLVRLPQARLVPLRQLLLRMGEIEWNKPVYFICKKGMRSKKAAELAQNYGRENVAYVEGGMDAWQQNGYPMEEGKKTISVERQTRVAIGVLLLLGLALPGLGLIPWIIGVMLIYAGLKDVCFMEKFLAALPYNKDNSCSV